MEKSFFLQRSFGFSHALYTLNPGTDNALAFSWREHRGFWFHQRRTLNLLVGVVKRVVHKWINIHLCTMIGSLQSAHGISCPADAILLRICFLDRQRDVFEKQFQILRLFLAAYLAYLDSSEVPRDFREGSADLVAVQPIALRVDVVPELILNNSIRDIEAMILVIPDGNAPVESGEA